MATDPDQAETRKIEKTKILFAGAARDNFLSYLSHARWKEKQNPKDPF